MHLTGLVHDIGKIGVPAEVLQKTSALNDDEWAEMRRHSEIGANILIEVEDYQEVARIVRSHHERFDGAGYPDGLARDEIPLLARVIAVADAYNAMTDDPALPQRDGARGGHPAAGQRPRQPVPGGPGGRLRARAGARARGLPAAACKPDFSLESMQHPELTPPAPRLRTAAA